MKIKKIAICSTQVPFVYGGAEVLVEELDRQLKERNFQSEIIRIPFKWYPSHQLVNQTLIWRLLDLSESNGEVIDRVICTKYPTYVVEHPNKVTWLFHQHRQAYDLMGTEYSYLADTVEDFCSVQQLKNIDNNTLVESKKIFTISENVGKRLKKYNGIDSEALYPPTKYEQKYYSDSYGDYIFVAGRLDPLKRLDLMIKAMQYTHKNIKFVIAGKGSQENELKKLAQRVGVMDRVIFKGFVTDDELLSLYANCFTVYYSPRDEDYGFVTVEAFKSRKPVITTCDSGGVLEFVEDGRNGLITGNDPLEIAQSANYLYQQKAKCREFGEMGYKKVEKIVWDNVIKKLTAEY